MHCKRHSTTLGIAVALALVATAGCGRLHRNRRSQSAAAQAAAINYEDHIKPLMAAHCVQCHGEEPRAAGLRLDVYDDPTYRIGLAERWTLAYGRAAAATMPPAPGAPLSAEELAMWKAWLDAGMPRTAADARGRAPLTCDALDYGAAFAGRLTRREVATSLRDLLYASRMLPPAAGESQPRLGLPFTVQHYNTESATNAIPETYVPGRYAGFRDDMSAEKIHGYFVFTQQLANTIPSEGGIYDRAMPCTGEFYYLQDDAPPEQLARRDACVRQSLADFAGKAWRRPLSEAEVDDVVRFYQLGREASGAQPGFQEGFVMAVQRIVLSPYFLYRVEIFGEPSAEGEVQLSDHEIAARLSYMLYQSVPDDELRRAAADPARPLQTPEGILAQFDRMAAHADYVLNEVKEQLFRTTLETFTGQWLQLDRVADPAARPRYLFGPAFAEADESFYAPLRREAVDEMKRVVSHVMLDEKGGLKELLATRWSAFPMNSPLYALYGIDGYFGGEDTMTVVELPPARAGILTRLAVLSQDHDETVPVKRGRLVRTQLLCDDVAFPTIENLKALGIDPKLVAPPIRNPSVSNRHQWEELTRPAPCQTCHAKLDALGFAFEGYDAVGQTRDAEKARDATGKVVATYPIDTLVDPALAAPGEAKVDGLAGLSAALAESGKAQACVAKQWFRFAARRQETEAESCLIERLQAEQAKGGLVGMMRALVGERGFRTKKLDR